MTMASSISSVPLSTTNRSIRSTEERWMEAIKKIECVSTRPTTLASEEFFSEGDNWRTLPRRLKRLCEVLENWDAENGSPELSCSFSKDPKESRRMAMTAAIMASSNPSFLSSFQSLFRASLRYRQKNQDKDNNMDDGDNFSDDDGIFMGREQIIFQNLRTLGWVRPDGILKQPLGDALYRAILSQVRETIEGSFEESGHFWTVEAWTKSVVDPWLRDLVGPETCELDNWSSRLEFCTAECYCLVRMDEIFDIVAEYPDSHPAVLELQDVLEKTKMYSSLGDSLRSSLVRRLNHPGANTSQIIDVYINTIKVLRVIDPSDRLLEVVTEPVRSYLRGRNDTVRCIITSLTDAEVGGDLYEELRRQDARPLEHIRVDSDDEEDPPDFDWQPPPSVTNPKGTFLTGGKGGGGDILSMLVSIYGSKELFVNEYRLMLADKLLANLDFNTDKEVHTLELLKLRFGEMSMRNCEIMIKDMDDSKRVVSNIHSTIKTKDARQRNKGSGSGSANPPIEPVVDAAVVSHIFWPALQNEQLKHHPRIQADLDQFSLEFARLKNPRRLIWLDQLGSVQLELDVMEESSDGAPVIETRQFNCSPLLATLISHFADKEQWSAEDLSNETGIAEHIIQKRMGYWVSNRVVKIIPPSASTTTAAGTVVYQVATREHWLQGGQDIDTSMMMMDLDGCNESGQAVSIVAQEEEEMEAYESYIVGMLTNLGQLPLNRIHNMLKTFVSGSDIKYNKTPQQLSAFLKYLCKQEKLECGPDGMYKLFKK